MIAQKDSEIHLIWSCIRYQGIVTETIMKYTKHLLKYDACTCTQKSCSKTRVFGSCSPEVNYATGNDNVRHIILINRRQDHFATLKTDMGQILTLNSVYFYYKCLEK